MLVPFTRSAKSSVPLKSWAGNCRVDSTFSVRQRWGSRGDATEHSGTRTKSARAVPFPHCTTNARERPGTLLTRPLFSINLRCWRTEFALLNPEWAAVSFRVAAKPAVRLRSSMNTKISLCLSVSSRCREERLIMPPKNESENEAVLPNPRSANLWKPALDAKLPAEGGVKLAGVERWIPRKSTQGARPHNLVLDMRPA
jgi:hypothetical protein